MDAESLSRPVSGGPPESGWSRWPAPAKLNLFLHIVGRRDDGYHLLQTAFRLLDWGDTVRLRPRSDGVIARHGASASGIAERDDLTVRAAELLRKEAKKTLGADIVIEKRIPVGGGFGGGSSDAATTLLALDRLWGLGLGEDRLAKLGLALGADVPVFVRGRNAWAEGVGERLTPIAVPAACYLIVDPQVHVATSELFQAIELTRNAAPLTIADFISGASSGRAESLGHIGLFGNAFEPVLRRRAPAVEAAFVALKQVGVPRLTGSGSGCFVEFADRGSADAALARFPSGLKAWVAEGATRSPMLDALDADRARNEQCVTR